MDTRRDEAPTTEEIAAADEAMFAMERVPRGRSVKPVALIALVIAGLAVAGVLTSAHGPTAAVAPSRAPAATAATAVANGTARSRDADGRDWNAFKNGDDRVTPPLLALDAQASAGLVFVHGDVYTRGASYVVVRLANDAGTLDLRALDMPGGSTAFRTGPNDRFSVSFQLIDPLEKPALWVFADAYDHNGAIIATARAAVGPA